MDFDNLHQVLRNLYQEMMPLCGDMIGVAKGIAGLGALFYVAYRVWKALANAEPIDVFPLLRPFAIGLCVMFFPTVVLGTINAVMSPVVQGTHAILEGQTLDLQAGMNEMQMQLASFVPMCCSINLLKAKSGSDERDANGRWQHLFRRAVV